MAKNNVFNPFGINIHRTERTANQILIEWFNQIIKKENLPFGLAEQETIGPDNKQPDVILYKEPGSRELVLVVELKPPYFNPLDYELVKKPAWEKAAKRHAPYFATCNLKQLILFNTRKANEQLPEIQQIVHAYTLSEIGDLELLTEPSYQNQIQKTLAIFLRDLVDFVFKKKAEKKLAVDAWLILLLQSHIAALASFYQGTIHQQALNNLSFRRRLRNWFNQQGWSFVLTDRNIYYKAARQTAYWLTNKILFYDALRAVEPQKFLALKIPDDYTSGGMLQGLLQLYFEQVLKLDYETIFSTDFIDEIAFPEDRRVVDELRKLTANLNRFDFQEIGFEVLGRIFENLLPGEERHLLGQYYTNSEVVDLLLGFCLRNEKDKVFDPGCGAGTFLRRAYHWKKLLNPDLQHEELLGTLWGNDIDKFAVGLATINLAIADLTSRLNYPRILQNDFFDLRPGRIDLTQRQQQIFLKGLGGVAKTELVPKFFDALVGNPPYTRQEEITGKEGLIGRALLDEVGKEYAHLAHRAGLYAYFLIHATKFLKSGGRLGFIVSNSWLDVEYGRGLQEHLLKHYQIKAIIESKVERWFTEAEINTVLLLLEKRQNKDNLVRFVLLKKPLKEFLPPASRLFEETVERKAAVEKLLTHIFSKTANFENADVRVYLKKQAELAGESKWGKYLRAPGIYFRVLQKAKDKLVPLKKVAAVRFGIKTGVNKFFYLTEQESKRWKIEKEFWMHQHNQGKWTPNYVIKSPRECTKLVVDPADLKYRLLLIHQNRAQLRGKKVLDYIRWGELQGFNLRPTCASRKNWWNIGIWEKPDLVWPDAYNNRYGVYDADGFWGDKRFFYINLKDKKTLSLVHGYLCSSVIPLLIENEGVSNLGEGVIYTNVYQVQDIFVPTMAAVKNVKILSDLERILKKLSQRNFVSF
jgi:type I restriction-modification system DNA methylase subunit